MLPRTLIQSATLSILISCVALAQPTTGQPPFGSFSGGPFDTVNNANLNVHFGIPVVSKAGRGMPFSYTLTYDSSVWSPVSSSGSSAWTPVGNWGWAAVTQAETGYITYTTTQGSCTNNGTSWYYWNNYNGFNYHDTFGTSHPIGVSASTWSGYPCGGGPPNPMTMTAPDGSGYSMTVGTSGGSLYATVARSDGAILYPPLQQGSGAGGSVTDSNGNQIAATYNGSATTFTDTLGTTALTVSGSGTQSSPLTFGYTNPQSQTSSYTMKYTSMTVQTAFGCPGKAEYGPTSGVNLVSSIVLPDNTQYTIAYEATPGHPNNVTGRIASITLPTGGTITYQYHDGSNGITCSDGSTATLWRQTPDSAPNYWWKYVHTEPSGTNPWTTTITDPQSNVTSLSFQGTQVVGSPVINALYEVQRQVNMGTSGTLTVNTCYNGTATNCTTAAVIAPITQVAVTKTLPSLTGNTVQSKTVSLYDPYGFPTEVDEYDYGSSSSSPQPGSLARKTTITYAFASGPVNRPWQINVYYGGGAQAAQTTYAYDQTGVVATSGTPQHVAASGARGNATTVSRWVSGSTTLSQTFTYYDTGNVYTATDVNNAQTTYTYGSGISCGNSFVTGTALPLSLSTSATWDVPNCYGAVQKTATDANGKTTTTYYNDGNFWRPTSVVDPSGATTSIAYPTPNVSESGLTFATNSTVDTRTTLDGLGRPHISQTLQQQNGSNYDSIETDYDSVGRPYRVTIPYSAAAGGLSSGVATITAYDALNRPKLVTDSGGGTTAYTYNQNDVLVAVGSPTVQRQFEYDALGRLTSVCEISATLSGRGTCGQNASQTGFWTKYTNDPLGNILSVAQNAQTGATATQSRSYNYDGLGRMTSEFNPEVGQVAVLYNYDTDGTCGTSYGDMVKRTDAAVNVICYAYDALHRVTKVTANSGPNASRTPTKHFVYDSATVNGVGMLNAKGQLAEAYTDPSMTTDLGFSYSVRGETTDVYQKTAGVYYHVSAGYWAAGPAGVLNTLNLNLSGYPSWTYLPDGEGRISAVTASTGQNPAPPLTPPPYNTDTTYNVFGLPNGVTLGSGDSDTFTYDSNTGRMLSYQAALGVSPSVSLTVNGAQSGSSYLDTDGFTVNVNGAANTAVYVEQTLNGVRGNNTQVGTTNSSGAWSTGGSWGPSNDGTYTQVWSVGSTAATPTLNFSLGSPAPTPAGPTTSILGPSSSGTLAWNSNGSLAQLNALDGFNSGSAQKFGNSQSCAYTHDDLGRLSTVDCGAGKWGQNFTYGSDNFGNINWTTLSGHVGSTFTQFGYDPGTNHYTGGPTYDLNGNLLSDVAHTYTWDADGNLYQIDSGTAMVYDALDRRVEQPNGFVILYGPDGSKLALMSGQTVTRAFVPLPGGATAVYQGTNLAWYRHADWLGSSRLASTPATRTVYYDGAYAPFGETIGETGTADRNFTGQNQDLGATDEYDFMYRQYHATQGRWIQPDPAGLASVDPTNPQSWNRYGYVNNSPLTNVDPDGQGIFGDIFGIVLGPVGWVFGEVIDLALGGEPGPPPPALGGSYLGGGLSLGGLTQCGGPFGTCGNLGAGPWSEQLPGLRGPTVSLGGAGIPGGVWGSGQIDGGGGINTGGIWGTGSALGDVMWGPGQVGGGMIFSWDKLTQCGDFLCDSSGKIIRANPIGMQEDIGTELIGVSLARGLADAIGFKYGGLHPAHHNFPLLGKQLHFQWNIWIKGVKSSGFAFRIPWFWGS